MTEKQQRWVIISGFIILSLIMISITTLIFNADTTTESSTDLEQNEFIDPATGDTLLSPEGKSPETYGTNPDAPIFVGFSSLYQYGARQTVVENTKAFLNDYANKRIVKNEEKIEEVSIVVDTIRHTINNEENIDSYTFDTIMNRNESYRIVITMRDITSMTISLFSDDSDKAIAKKTYEQ